MITKLPKILTFKHSLHIDKMENIAAKMVFVLYM